MSYSQIDDYFKEIKNLKLASLISSLRFYLKNILFKEISFSKKNVLDIGAGTGVYSCYMAINGAKKVIGLEPEMEGSRNNYIAKFEELKKRLDLDNVFLKPSTFQSFNNEGDNFDIILLHSSINHLNEEACINLTRSYEARKAYEKIFNKLYSISNNNSDLIIADCSNKNFFNFLGIKNPFSPTIEWHKHQAPEEWAKIIKKTSYKNVKIKWVAPLRKIGNIFFGNKICSFFIHSHFIIYAKK